MRSAGTAQIISVEYSASCPGAVYCGTIVYYRDVLGQALYGRNSYLGVIAIDLKLSKPHRSL